MKKNYNLSKKRCIKWKKPAADNNIEGQNKMRQAVIEHATNYTRKIKKLRLKDVWKIDKMCDWQVE